MSAQVQPRDRRGQFVGERLDLECVPLVPATAMRMLLRNPRRTLVLIWAGDAANRAEYVVTLDAVPGIHDTIRIAALAAHPVTVRFVRQACPKGAVRLVWRCPACGRCTPHLFVAGFRDDGLRFGIACRICSGLRHWVQGGSVIRKRLTRTLAGLEPDRPLPRSPLVPHVITSDLRALKRFKNLSVAEAPDGAPSGVVN